MSGNFNIVIYAIENSFVSPQKIPSHIIEDYVHKDIHIGNVFGETWGRPLVDGTIATGTKLTNDFSYKIPNGLTPETMHFLILVYNRDIYEIEQVIKHHF